MTSHLETACLALWLVDVGLLDVRAKVVGKMAGRVWLRLDWLGVRDEASAREVAGRLFAEEPSLLEVLDRLGRDLFAIRRGQAVLKADHSLPQGRRLIRVVDPDALVALHPDLVPAPQDRFDWPAVPMDDGGLISGLAAKGAVDTHIHLGGALPPCFYWILFVSGAVAPEGAGALVASDRGHAGAADWTAAVRRATWLRFALALEVEERIQKRGEPRVFPHLPPIGDAVWDLFRSGEEERLGKLTSLELRESLSGLTRSLRRGEMSKEWLLYDPLREPCMGGARGHHGTGERRLLTWLRRLLEDAGSEAGKILARRLLEYLRVRNAFHGLLVHDQGSEGLLRFSESLKRRGLGQPEPRRRNHRKRRRFQRALLQMEEVRMEAALNAQLIESFDREEPKSREKPWRRIEMRVSVPAGPLSFRLWRAWIDGIARHLRPRGRVPGPRSQVGLVFHLHKRKSGQAAEEARQEARRLYHFLAGYPGLRPLVVGFDTAGSERAAPPRTFLPAYRELQRLVSKHRPQPDHPSIRIGYTYHVGEDCADLLTGLRHVDEVVSLLLPEEEGGRLGHALVLAEDPRRFYARRGSQTEPKTGAHLLDLVWAWGRLLTSDRASVCQDLQRKILRLAGGMDLTPLYRCWEAMGLDAPGGVDAAEASERDLLDLLGFQGKPERTQVQADEPWLRLLADLQALLRERLLRRRVCIEANPTSNLIIGGYNAYGEIPCLALAEAGLPVSINTDDPGMFMTSLPGEAAALYAALERKETPHRAALAWLADRWFDAENSTFLGTPRRWSQEDICTMLRYKGE